MKKRKYTRKGRHWIFRTLSEYGDDVEYLVADYPDLIRFAAFKPGIYHGKPTMDYYIQTKVQIRASRLRRTFDYSIFGVEAVDKYSIPTGYTDVAGVFVTQGKRIDKLQ